MYWYKKIIILLSIFLAGCALKDDSSITKQNIQAQKSKAILSGTSYKENFDILRAFYALGDGENAEALDIFYDLYKKTNDNVYLKEALKISFFINDPRLRELVNLAASSFKNDEEISRIIIGFHMINYNFDAALKEALILVKNNPKSAINHSVLGSVYEAKNNKLLALEEFKKAYKLDRNERNLFNLASFLSLKMNKNQKAQTYIEKWLKNNPCDKKNCSLLIGIYAKSKQDKKIVQTYIELYETYKEEDFLNAALSLLLYKKNIDKAIEILQIYRFNDKALMELYSIKGEYKRAFELANELYLSTLNPEFKANMAIYGYEGNINLAEVIRLFEESVYKVDSAIYYNYYGYLLIDHDIDIKKGLELVKKAYKLKPDSPFILDSLAWGYYKAGNFQEAKFYMDKAVKFEDFMKSKEVIEHKKLIENALEQSLKGEKI